MAADDDGRGIVGVAPDTKVMALKFLGANGTGSAAAAINSLNYASMMRSRYGVNIVASNNSWGGVNSSQELGRAIEDQAKVGIVFVAAAGNKNSNTDAKPTYPAGYDLPNVISVGATNAADAKASFSNYGRQSVDVFAPGQDILSTLPNGRYGSLSGTSMAAPHVAGTVALLAAANPKATMEQLRDAVLSSVDFVPTLDDLCRTSGRLNAARAIREINDNRPPVAVPDQATAQAGKSVEIPVLANDSDPDGDAISVRSFNASSANGGSVERKGPNRPNVLLYTPRPGFVGTDRFQYTIGDSHHGTATAVVEIVVTSPPPTPKPPRDHATLVAGDRLLPGQEIHSADNRSEYDLFF